MPLGDLKFHEHSHNFGFLNIKQNNLGMSSMANNMFQGARDDFMIHAVSSP